MRDWAQTLADAKRSGGFDDDAKYDADRWATCAVGEARAERPSRVKLFMTAPKDRNLYRVGMRFYEAVAANDIPGAFAAYGEVQALTAPVPKKRRS